MKQKVFISSVQKEFAEEREAMHHHLLSDPVLHLFFDPILFEKLPANGEQPQQVYLKEVSLCDIFIILIGKDYGYETAEGISPTELEYQLAQKNGKFSLAFIKSDSETGRHPKEVSLFKKIQNQLSYKRFSDTAALLREITKSLVSVLQQQGLIQTEGFDSTIATQATMADIDENKVNHFIGIAKYKRGFPLREGSALSKVLSHLNLLLPGGLSNSALLAFGKNPQQFFPPAVVKCAHFHGTFVSKPIPDHRVIKGDVFTQVDEAVDFVLSKIAITVGMRLQSNQAPIQYEIPRPVIAEAIVNAIAHRDYQSTGSVQVMIFSDRISITNPGGLPMELTLEKLKYDHASYPRNPHLAETLYQAGYIERFGTGTGEIYRLCREAGLPEPSFNLEEGFSLTFYRPSTDQVTDQVTDHDTDHDTDFVDELVKRLILMISNPKSRTELMEQLDLRHNPNFRDNYLRPALEGGYIEMTLPDKPQSTKQRYRLTPKGQTLKKILEKKQ